MKKDPAATPGRRRRETPAPATGIFREVTAMRMRPAETGGEYVAFDVETTGMSPLRGHRVIEIGAVRIVNGVLDQEFHSLIDCGRAITAGAVRVHGIAESMLHGKPKPQEAFLAFRSFIGKAILVAHNARFDFSFLQNEYSRLGWHLANRILCTLKAGRQRLPRLPDYRLETVARHLLGELPEGTRLHRALDDARLVARVWVAMEAR